MPANWARDTAHRVHLPAHYGPSQCAALCRPVGRLSHLVRNWTRGAWSECAIHGTLMKTSSITTLVVPCTTMLALSKNPHRSSPSTDRRPAPARSVQRTRMHCNKSISVPSAVHRHSTHSLARPHHPLGGIQSSALFLFFSLQGSGHFRPPCSEINGRAMRSAARPC